MTDSFDPGDDDERLVAALQAIAREAGLDACLDLRVPERGSRAGQAILLLNRADRLLEELGDLDEGLEAAGDWSAVVFKPDPDLPELYREPGTEARPLLQEAALPWSAVMDRERRGEREGALRRAQKAIGELRRAVRRQD